MARKNWRIHEKEIITKINNNDDFCNHIMAELPKIKQKIKVTENTINRLNIKIQELDIKEFKKEVLILVNKKSLEILYCIITNLIKKQKEKC